MEKGKIIVIEGTDCSGKETQSKKLIERLRSEGEKTIYYSFPKYDTPSGRIVGLSYLGKPYLAEELVMEKSSEIKENIREKYDEKISDKVIETVLKETVESLSHGWFPETAPNVDPKVSCLYYAADRRYNLPVIEDMLSQGLNIILDRYTYSNMAHQGGKINEYELWKTMYEWIASLEFNYLGLPKSDVRLFLHMPTDYATILKQGREEKLDENEKNQNHLRDAERAYVEVANLYDFDTIECIKNQDEIIPTFENIKTPDEISEEVYDVVKRKLTLK